MYMHAMSTKSEMIYSSCLKYTCGGEHIYNRLYVCVLYVHLFAANQSRMNPLRTGAEEKSGFNKTQLRIESAIYVRSWIACWGMRE